MIDRSLPRVLFLSHTPLLAGAERALINLLAQLPRGTLQPLVAFPHGDGAGKTFVRDTLRLPVFELPFGISLPMESVDPRAIAGDVEIFRQAFIEMEIDAVVVNTTTLYPATIAAARVGLPVLLHSHGILDKRLLPQLDLPRWHRYQALQLQLADTVLVPSEWVSRYYQDVYSRSASSMTILPNGTPLPSQPAPAATGAPQFVMLCTLESNKGVLDFLAAAARVLEQRPNGAAFHIYGDGSATYKTDIERFIRRHHLGAHCFVHGKVTDVSGVYRDCRAAVVASHIESFSFVTIEAMAAGRAVIATRCGGPEDIVVDGTTGYLVPVAEPEALAARLVELIDHPETAVAMGHAGRRRAEEKYDIGVIATQYADVILATVDMARADAWRQRKQIALSLADPQDIEPGAAMTTLATAPAPTHDNTLQRLRNELAALQRDRHTQQQALLESLEGEYAHLRNTNAKARNTSR